MKWQQWDKFSTVFIIKWKVKSHVVATLKSCTKLPSIDMKSSQHTPRKWTLIFNFLFTFCPSSIYSWFIKLLFLLHSGFKLWYPIFIIILKQKIIFFSLSWYVTFYCGRYNIFKKCPWKLEKKTNLKNS